MATINGLAIFVEQESVQDDIASTDHPTEQGLPLTSGIQRQPIKVSLQGVIVDNGKYTAKQIRDNLKKLQKAGSLVTYKGNNTISNLQIQSFNGDWSNKNWGGFAYTMELKEVRIAKPAYVKKAATTPPSKKTTPTLKVGATVVFKGGYVYVSSDAPKAAANKGRQTCKITKINTRSWAKHQYHLISTEKKYPYNVYGWVDKANIEGSSSTSSTKKKTNGGTQQTKQGKTKAVYHKTKKGDTVYNLVNKKYKSLGKSVDWVMKNNPKAFTKKNDPKTLKVNYKLLVGYK